MNRNNQEKIRTMSGKRRSDHQIISENEERSRGRFWPALRTFTDPYAIPFPIGHDKDHLLGQWLCMGSNLDHRSRAINSSYFQDNNHVRKFPKWIAQRQEPDLAQEVKNQLNKRKKNHVVKHCQSYPQSTFSVNTTWDKN